MGLFSLQPPAAALSRLLYRLWSDVVCLIHLPSGPCRLPGTVPVTRICGVLLYKCCEFDLPCTTPLSSSSYDGTNELLGFLGKSRKWFHRSLGQEKSVKPLPAIHCITKTSTFFRFSLFDRRCWVESVSADDLMTTDDSLATRHVREAAGRLTHRRTLSRACSHANIMEPEPNTAKAAAINEYGKLMLSHKVRGITHTPV